MSRRGIVVLVLVAALLPAGCAPYRSSRTCEEIAAAKLRAVMEGAASLEQAIKRVTEAFHVEAKHLEITRSPDNSDDYALSWSANGVQYGTDMLSSRMVWAGMTYESKPPSADEVIECLGAPDRYWAFYYPPDPGVSARRPAELTFYFAALGIACWGNKYGTGSRPPQFDGGTPMQYFEFVPLGPPDEVLNRLIHAVNEGQEERIKKEVKPWPGDWQKVEVQTGFD